jgi:hypothetical protein
MIHLEKLGFLLLIAIGALLYAAVRGNPHLRRARDWMQTHLWSFIVLLASCFTIVIAIVVIAIYASADVNFVEHPLIRNLNTPIFVKIPLALLCGALFVELASVVKKPEFTPLYLSVRAVPFVFFFTIGFFSYELQQSFQFLTRIEAAGVTLDFNAASAQETQSLLNDPSQGGVSDARTAFQLGISLLPEAFGPVNGDYKRVSEWCDKFDALECGHLRATLRDLEKVRTALQTTSDVGTLIALEKQRQNLQTQAEAARAARQRLDELFASTQRYLEILEPLQQCLAGIYVNTFPNGSPIQDELSEFATIASIDYPRTPAAVALLAPDPNRKSLDSAKAAYSSPPGSADHAMAPERPTYSFAPGSNRDFHFYLLELREKLVRFGDYVQQYNSPGSDPTALCQNLRQTLSNRDIDELVEVRQQLAKLNEGVAAPPEPAATGSRTEEPAGNASQSDNEPVLLRRKFSLPYESIFEASIVAASGYPEEAARHLAREYKQLTSTAHEQHFGIATNDFVDFLLQVRMLSPMEAIFAYSRNRTEQVNYAEALVDRVEIQLQKIKPFPDGKRSGFVELCGAGQLIEDSPEMDQVMRGEVESYFRNITHFYLRSYARLLESVAFDPGVFTRPERFSKFTRVAEDLGRLASVDSTALNDCIGKTFRTSGIDEETVTRIIELLRFDLLAAYGFILARQADQREIDPEIAPHIDRSYKMGATCKAQHVLLNAWRLRRISADGAAETTYTEKTYKIRSILEQINRSGVNCLS